MSWQSLILSGGSSPSTAKRPWNGPVRIPIQLPKHLCPICVALHYKHIIRNRQPRQGLCNSIFRIPKKISMAAIEVRPDRKHDTLFVSLLFFHAAGAVWGDPGMLLHIDGKLPLNFDLRI